MSVPQAVAALIKAFWHVLNGLRVLRTQFPKLNAQQRQIRVQQWSLDLLHILGVDLEI